MDLDRGAGTVTVAGLIESGRDFANVAEVAQVYQVHEATVRRRCDDGTIPAVKIGDWRIPVRWLAEQAQVTS